MSNAFHVMTKPTGAIRNLDCEYCFFLAKEQLYPGSSFRMDDDVHAAYIEQLPAAHADAPEAVVAFQGSEPTMMGLEFFSDIGTGTAIRPARSADPQHDSDQRHPHQR